MQNAKTQNFKCDILSNFQTMCLQYRIAAASIQYFCMFKLVYFKQKLVYLKCILFFPSSPFNFLSGKPVLKVNILPLLYLANNSERSDLIKNQCYEAALYIFLRQALLPISKQRSQACSSCVTWRRTTDDSQTYTQALLQSTRRRHRP